MTESTQTIPVPVDLLKRLFENTTLTRDVFEGDSVDVRPSGIGALIDIKALVPDPPKVGDVLDADEVRQLPPGAVLTDGDDDVWIRYGVEKVYLASDGVSANRLPVSTFGPYTVIYLRPGD